MASEMDVTLPFRLTVDEAKHLQSQFGTPLYVLSEAHLRNRASRYLRAARAAWPLSEVSFASKANGTLAVLAVMASEGLGIDVASEGELRAAIAAGVDPGRCHLHGNNKSQGELDFAIGSGIGMIMVDNCVELDRLAVRKPATKLALRLAPGVDPITHEKISTGQSDTKFGFNIADGAAARAVNKCVDAELNLVGVHCHVGSNLFDPQAQCDGGSEIASFLRAMEAEHGLRFSYVNAGGGLGVRYTEQDDPMEIEEYCTQIAASVKAGLAGQNEGVTLGQEPGRSLVAEAGITLYSVGVVKDVPTKTGSRRYVVVNGGLADNPRPVMYGAVYSVLAASRESHDGPVTRTRISGRHCESDMLFDNIDLPTDIQPGELLQVLCTGAYNASMANNYNGYPRPRSVMKLLSGDFVVVQEPDTWAAMIARDRVPIQISGAVCE